jgi:PIN domain nuclease of toxin-antitoxin system
MMLLLDTHVFLWYLEALLSLPLHHRDPFDRLLIAQAIAESVLVLSDDRALIMRWYWPSLGAPSSSPTSARAGRARRAGRRR